MATLTLEDLPNVHPVQFTTLASLQTATAPEPRGGQQSARPVGAVRALPKQRFGNCETLDYVDP
ncbi:hypothetical protein [Pseudophaeobacter sp.]|uniref:hypothetical protein n=1 Tax=Pseudophaeobacter sp. TaxID=1971739 RepID=UPI003299DE19